MTYLVLARKWRPRSFDTLVGQDHVVRALSQALATQRLHHAWLFTGTRGVGKTTLSRIMAKALNCQSGITATPCNTCVACQGIDADRYPDYLELDAASNRGVEEMTRLLEQAVYAPAAGRFKVYMIDEVHMLSGHAFNAMLKTLEEPPPHVKFILATTDPQKIPVTVLSRCLQFNLKQMPPDAVARHLDTVLQAEAIPAEAAALRLIGQAARGSMRDALSLADQAIAYSGANVTESAVREMLGTIDQRYLVRLLDALSAADGPGMVAVADELAARSLSYSSALGELAGLLSQIAMAQRIAGLPDDDAPMAEDIRRLAGQLSPDAVQLFYSIALHSRPELALAPDEYAGFVMACLRMLAFTSASDSRDASAGIGAATSGMTPGHQASAGGRHDRESGPAPARGEPALGALPTSSPRAGVTGAGNAPLSGLAAARAAVAGLQRGGARKTVPRGLSETAQQPAPAGVPTADAPALDKPRVAAPVAAAPLSPPAAAAPAPGVPRASLAPLPASSRPSAPTPWSAVPLQSGSPDSPRAAAPAEDLPPWDEDDAMIAAAAAQAAASAPDYESENPAPPDWQPDPPAAAPKPRPAQAAPQPAPARPGSGTGPSGLTLAEPWPVVATQLPLRGMAAELARQAEWVGFEGDTVVLKVAARTLAQGPSVERLRVALAGYFGQAVQLRMEVGETGSGTAHAVAQSEREARQREAEQAIDADPFVQTLLTQFGGEVVPGSIKPA